MFLCFYRRDRKSTDIVQWGEGEKYGEVQVDRNRMMTLLIEQIKDTGRLTLNGTKEEWEEFASHFGNIYREKVESKDIPEKDNAGLYSTHYVWKRNGADHYVHALLYAVVGLQKYGGQLAKIIAGDDIWRGTPRGRIVEPQPESSSMGVILGPQADI